MRPFDAVREGSTMRKHLLVLLFAFLAYTPLLLPQGLGSIVGRVTDPSGAAVASAKVIATELGTGFSRSATSDTDGLYVIPSLHPATYSLSVEATGFSTSRQPGVTLLADQTLTVNVALRLGATTEVVTVTGFETQVDTSTSTLRQVVEQERISELPLNGRNAATLTLLVAGAVNSPNGGGVVNVVTKSGTNSFHGDAFEFVRNPVFNAQNFFATPTTPDSIKRNQYGGTIGGPVFHDKTFFFAGYQRTAFRNLLLGSSKVVGQTDIANFLAGGRKLDPSVATMLGIDPTTGTDLGAGA